MPAQSDQPDTLSFEDAMDRLDTIVASMEGERMPLEEMVSSYELGARLLKSCRQRIENARKRVDLITADLDGTGKASLSDFDADAAEAEAPAPARTRSTTTTPRRTSTAKPASEDADDIRLF